LEQSKLDFIWQCVIDQKLMIGIDTISTDYFCFQAPDQLTIDSCGVLSAAYTYSNTMPLA
jgi:hypothetical protein